MLLILTRFVRLYFPWVQVIPDRLGFASFGRLEEELGIVAADALEPLFKLPASADTGWEFVWVYRLTHDGPLDLNAEEISGGDWFTPAAIDTWIS